MTVELDQVVRVGAVTIAALVKRSIHGDVSHAVSIHGVKRPVAVLIHRDDMTILFEINGSQIALDTFERRFSGQRAEFERIAMSDTLHSRQPKPTDRQG